MGQSYEVQCLLIRHGKTQGNVERRYVGCRTDEHLCDEGIAQMQWLKKHLPECTSRCHLFTSPLVRARESAAIAFGGFIPEVIEEMKEIDFGEFEGKNYQQLAEDRSYLTWLASRGILPFPHGEPRDIFVKRNVEAFRKVVLAHKTSQDPLIFMVHGGSIMAVLSELTGKDYYDFQVANGNGYEVIIHIKGDTIDGVSYHILFDGDTP
ncbi:MAG: histidine phosphatase family protein [Lachnospiraceae bacterium]|nr:histidine phosphatase family protein [Lachnospiraceae bacterium]